MAFAPGVEKEQALREAGFDDQDIGQWKGETAKSLSEAGFGEKEVHEYFGATEPDMGPMKAYVEKNLQAYQAQKAEKAANSTPSAIPGAEPKPAEGLLEAIQAGFQTSVSGLLYHKKNPDLILPHEAPAFYRIMSKAASLAGDIPFMVPGFLAGAAGGAAVGSAVPVVGNLAGGVIGGGAGSFALPEAMRSILMQHYEKGDIKDFGDFWERSSAVFLDTLKAGVIGGATAGVGGVAGKFLGKATPALRTGGTVAAEVGTMVSVGSAMNGEVPSAEEFMDAAVLVGGLRGAGAAARRLRTTYSKTGAKPAQLAMEAERDPVLKQELLVEGDQVPTAVEGLVGPKVVEPPKFAPAKEAVPPTEVEVAQSKILSQVGEKSEAPKKSYTRDDFYKDFVDRLDPIKEAVGELAKDPKALDVSKDPYKLSRMANDYKAKVKYFFEKGVVDFKTLEKTSKPFTEIVEPFQKDMNGLKAYLLSKRAVELNERGIKTGFDIEAAKAVVKDGSGTFETAAKELVDFQNGALKYLKDSGVVSLESYKNLVEAGKSYISFKRISEEGEVSGGSKSAPLKKIKGSDLKVQDPFLSMIENTELYVKLAERNRAVSALVELAEKAPDQKIIEKVPTAMRPVEISEAEVGRIFKEQGIVADPQAVTVFRGQARTLGLNEFEVFRNGKREVYQTSSAIAEAIKTLDGNGAAQNIFFRLARGVTTVKRLGISLTPDFLAKNVFRDQLTAGVFSKGGTIPFIDMLSAVGDLIKKNDHYYEWLKSGGANGAFLEMGERYLKNDIYKLNAETGNFLKRIWNVAETAWQKLAVIGSLAEQSTRLAEFKRVSGGSKNPNAILEGGFASREVTVDFQRVGAKVAAFNAITAFQNVGIQGLDRTVRAIKEDPKGVALKAVASLTVPSVLLWWAQHDDERYKQTPRYIKDLFWIILTDNWQAESTPGEARNFPAHLVRTAKDGSFEINKGHEFRIPKPQELGLLFGSLPERLLEKFFTDNPKAGKDFGKTMAELLTPSLIPDILTPGIEQAMNKSTFTGNKLVPTYLEGQLPQYQYTHYTSETAKALGKIFQAVPFLNDLGPKDTPVSSPIVIDNYIRSWTGTLGDYAVKVVDQGLIEAGIVPDPIKPASALADIPFIKAFVVRYPSGAAQSIVDFHARYRETEKFLNTKQALIKAGNVDALTKELSSPENLPFLMKLSGVNESLNQQSRVIQGVFQNPKMKPEEKRQLIDMVYFQMIETAKAGNQFYQEIDAILRK